MVNRTPSIHDDRRTWDFFGNNGVEFVGHKCFGPCTHDHQGIFGLGLAESSPAAPPGFELCGGSEPTVSRSTANGPTTQQDVAIAETEFGRRLGQW